MLTIVFTLFSDTVKQEGKHMLVSSIVINTLGIKSQVVKKVTQNSSGITVKLDIYKRRRQPYGTCGKLGRVRDRLKERSWKHVPLWGIPVTLKYSPARVRCMNCCKIRVEHRFSHCYNRHDCIRIPARIIGSVVQARRCQDPELHRAISPTEQVSVSDYVIVWDT